MVMLVKNTNEYLYEKKRDIFLLEIRDQNKKSISFDRDNEENKAIIAEQCKWLDEHNVKYAPTVGPGVLVGWDGYFYVDFDGWDDPAITSYSSQFEDSEGKSLTPDKFRMVALSYEQWVNAGKLAEHEQWMKDLESGNVKL